MSKRNDQSPEYPDDPNPVAGTLASASLPEADKSAPETPTSKPRSPRRVGDDEVKAMFTIVDLLNGLGDAERRRVLAYLRDRFAPLLTVESEAAK